MSTAVICCMVISYISVYRIALIFQGAKFLWLVSFEIFEEIYFTGLSFSSYLSNSAPNFLWCANFMLQRILESQENLALYGMLLVYPFRNAMYLYPNYDVD